MKTSKYIFGLIFLIMGILGCSKEESESIENVRETLIGSTWIQHSRTDPESSDFESIYYKDKYDFYENGEYRVTGLLGIPHLFNDTLKIVGNWEYDKENRVINFTNVTIMVNEIGVSVRDQLKLIEINKDRFIALTSIKIFEETEVKELYVRKVK